MINIVIAGVGGQGSLLASRILSALYEARGETVKVSEVHGMSQRGGSVITTVRAGKAVYSPLITDGEGDILIAFEQIEALRYLNQLKPGGTVIMSTQRVMPMPVLTGAMPYPEGVTDTIRAAGYKVIALDALELAAKAGSPRTANVVVLGAASGIIGGTDGEWDAALAAAVKGTHLDINRKAFAAGRNAG
ncbi:MAG: indolepyruvate oxidoreductase subunit beta [Oscillospiraceae bacterium]|nr:indolepyruvate oxidoreductase subunit beta [Oscillospiraceae bacterium]